VGRYPVAERLARIAVPTTVVYGTEDGIVPPDQSRAVAAAAGDRPCSWLVAVRGADHNDRALLDDGVLLRAVIELADRATIKPDLTFTVLKLDGPSTAHCT